MPHLADAELLADYLRMPGAGTNAYATPAAVTWGTPGDPSSWSSQAKCASFISSVLDRAAPGFTADHRQAVYGSASPTARQYQQGLASDPLMVTGIAVPALLPGDLVAIDYGGTDPDNTGHIVMVRRVVGTYTSPYSSKNFAGEVCYAVEVVDCTSDPHGVYGTGDYPSYPDSRITAAGEAQGVGYGHMMLYASSTTGVPTRYRWSVNSSTVYTVADRPITTARLR